LLLIVIYSYGGCFFTDTLYRGAVGGPVVLKDRK